jgi:hypothetical protein
MVFLKKVLKKKKKSLRRLHLLVWLFFDTRKIKKIFEGKKIAIVGGAPFAESHVYGEIIDEHDLVVRINMPRNFNHELSGERTDVCFMGGNIKEISYIEKIKRALNKDTMIISTFKNKETLKNLKKIYKVEFFPSLVPLMVTKKMAKKLNLEGDILKILGGVPRSGFVCLSLILFYGKAEEVSIFGMSKDPYDARKTNDNNGAPLMYDEKSLLAHHCSPEKEIWLMKQVLDIYMEKVKWV